VSTLRAAAAALLCAAALAAPRLALACSVCSAGREDEAQKAFLLTTVFLSVLPLSVFAGFGIWLWRRHRIRERAELPVLAQLPAHAEPQPAPGAVLRRL
jgi:hypothetical protein